MPSSGGSLPAWDLAHVLSQSGISSTWNLGNANHCAIQNYGNYAGRDQRPVLWRFLSGSNSPSNLRALV